MIYILQNFGPIALATIAGLAIGAMWLRLSGKPAWSWRLAMLAAVGQFWLAAILAGALILAPQEAGPWIMALGSAFVIWLGFVLPALAVTLSAFGKGVRTILAACSYWLVVMLVQAAILQSLGLVAPPQA